MVHEAAVQLSAGSTVISGFNSGWRMQRETQVHSSNFFSGWLSLSPVGFSIGFLLTWRLAFLREPISEIEIEIDEYRYKYRYMNYVHSIFYNPISIAVFSYFCYNDQISNEMGIHKGVKTEG